MFSLGTFLISLLCATGWAYVFKLLHSRLPAPALYISGLIMSLPAVGIVAVIYLAGIRWGVPLDGIVLWSVAAFVFAALPGWVAHLCSPSPTVQILRQAAWMAILWLPIDYILGGFTQTAFGLGSIGLTVIVIACQLGATHLEGTLQPSLPAYSVPLKALFGAGLLLLIAFTAVGLRAYSSDLGVVYAQRSLLHPLGTDGLGHDVLAQAVELQRVVFLVAGVAAVISIGLKRIMPSESWFVIALPPALLLLIMVEAPLLVIGLVLGVATYPMAGHPRFEVVVIWLLSFSMMLTSGMPTLFGAVPDLAAITQAAGDSRAIIMVAGTTLVSAVPLSLLLFGLVPAPQQAA